MTFEPQGGRRASPPHLGTEHLRAGLLAAGIGMLAGGRVYSFFYYRMLGIVIFPQPDPVRRCWVFGAMVRVLGRQIGFTLTLAGIAGLIVSLGVAADSFVLYFERLKDEIREGRTPRAAADRAWVRARRTILSADTVSFLAAIILYFLSASARSAASPSPWACRPCIDVAVVFLFTRPLVSFLSRFPLVHATRPLSGMAVSQTAPTPRTAGAAPPRPPAVAPTRRPDMGIASRLYRGETEFKIIQQAASASTCIAIVADAHQPRQHAVPRLQPRCRVQGRGHLPVAGQGRDRRAGP